METIEKIFVQPEFSLDTLLIEKVTESAYRHCLFFYSGADSFPLENIQSINQDNYLQIERILEVQKEKVSRYLRDKLEINRWEEIKLLYATAYRNKLIKKTDFFLHYEAKRLVFLFIPGLQKMPGYFYLEQRKIPALKKYHHN